MLPGTFIKIWIFPLFAGPLPPPCLYVYKRVCSCVCILSRLIAKKSPKTVCQPQNGFYEPQITSPNCLDGKRYVESNCIFEDVYQKMCSTGKPEQRILN